VSSSARHSVLGFFLAVSDFQIQLLSILM